MYGKTIIITGGNRGIGKETAKELAKKGPKIILACRDLNAARNVQDEIIEETNNKKIVVKNLDLSSQKSIRLFANEINRNETRLDVLIHNAAVIVEKHQITEDDLEVTMATNHFGPFLLTHLLIDLLKKSAPSRIIITSSVSYHLSTLDIDNMNLDKFSLFKRGKEIYFDSKMANLCFMKELARRLEGTGVIANCVHPGIIKTGIWDNMCPSCRWILDPIVNYFFITPEDGCQTGVYLASSGKLEKVNGKYFVDCEERKVWGKVNDVGFTKKLWDISEKFANITRFDPKI